MLAKHGELYPFGSTMTMAGGEIFGDKVMAAALIDRRVHQGHIVNIHGNSYRLRQHAELARRLHQRPAAPTALEGKKKEGTATASG